MGYTPWPGMLDNAHGSICSLGPNTECGFYQQMQRAAIASATWPAASRAIYIAFTIGAPVTATQIGWENGTAVSGTMYVGIYDSSLTQLVTANAGQVNTSAFQAINITDTVLTPGTYWMAMALDNTTGTVFRAAGGNTAIMRVSGVQQQASATPLPAPAVLANPASAFIPYMAIATVATM